LQRVVESQELRCRKIGWKTEAPPPRGILVRWTSRFVEGQISLEDDVGSISASSPFSSVVPWVGVSSGPLKVDVVSLGNHQGVGDEVVFHGRVDLLVVAPLSSDVDVVDPGIVGKGVVARLDFEDMRPILEVESRIR
jgi:hypothetical protein